MPGWLVTGGSGFLGRHLLAELIANGPSKVAIQAIGRRCPVGWSNELFVELDLEDQAGLTKAIATIQPSCVFHLAGRTPPATTEEFDRLNTGVTVGLLEAIQSAGSLCRFVMVGSAAELGPVPVEALPVAEDYPCQPADPYGRSKLRATRASLGAPDPVETVVARVFNPVGPGLPESQAFGRFASVLAAGAGPVQLTVGDLDVRRDFIDVRDIASGLLALALRGTPGGVYHLGTGRSRSVGEGLERLIALSGRDVTIEVDADLARRRGPGDSRARVEKMAREIGWSPQISWEQSLNDLWVEAVSQSSRG